MFRTLQLRTPSHTRIPGLSFARTLRHPQRLGMNALTSCVMLTENDVIEAVCAFLTEHGWATVSTANTRQRGDDIIAEKNKHRLLIEAKGGTSSKEQTARFGVSFNLGQVRTHVAVAVLRSLRVVSLGRDIAALAFPDNDHHRAEVDLVRPALVERLGVVLFWVDETTRQVHAEGLPG